MISDNESKYVLLSNEAARTDEEVRGDAAEEESAVVKMETVIIVISAYLDVRRSVGCL